MAMMAQCKDLEEFVLLAQEASSLTKLVSNTSKLRVAHWDQKPKIMPKKMMMIVMAQMIDMVDDQ